MTERIQLLLIDPQNDFCDIPGAALPIPGALEDTNRLTLLITRLGAQLDAVTVTLDSHGPLDIAHPHWWQNQHGNTPEPLSTISEQDIVNGTWRTRNPAQQQASEEYVRELAASGRHQLIVWPEHCLVGSWGHAVEAGLFAALNRWVRVTLNPVNYVFKGQHSGTEHYSAIRAEVPDMNDPTTQTNTALLDHLLQTDTLLIAGQALSHCVACTLRDIVNYMPQDQLHKLVLLTDCCSPVPGFEEYSRQFIVEMTEIGMRCLHSIDV